MTRTQLSTLTIAATVAAPLAACGPSETPPAQKPADAQNAAKPEEPRMPSEGGLPGLAEGFVWRRKGEEEEVIEA